MVRESAKAADAPACSPDPAEGRRGDGWGKQEAPLLPPKPSSHSPSSVCWGRCSALSHRTYPAAPGRGIGVIIPTDGEPRGRGRGAPKVRRLGREGLGSEP